MGYTLMIGEFKSYKEGRETYYMAEEKCLDNAPADGSPTDRINQRWPSYSGWDYFTKGVGLSELMDELIASHPGYVVLKKRHKKIIDAAYAKKHTFDADNQGRLEWLKFWVDWALDNCKKPVFVNR
jgi:hypothetical protein